MQLVDIKVAIKCGKPETELPLEKTGKGEGRRSQEKAGRITFLPGVTE